MTYIYDIETFSNFFCLTAKEYTTKELKRFVIYKDRNDINELLKFIDNNKLWLIGYNNSYFDNQILNYIHSWKHYFYDENSDNIAKKIYEFAIKIVEDDWKSFVYNLPFKSLDLMKIGNLSQKSLKLVATLLKWHKIQDLPYEWSTKIEDSLVDTILDYNLNDVEITEALARLLEPQMRLRFAISKEYNIAVYNESDSGIANRLLEKFYEEATNIPKSIFKNWRTKRPRIGFWEVIFDDVYFRAPELREFLEELRKTMFFPTTPFMKKSVIFNNKKYIIGIGGLHSEDKGKVFKSSDKVKIIDSDISSYYPNMIINNNIYPQHLGNMFIKKYREVIEQRVEAKRKSKDKRLSSENRDKYRIQADTLKIVGNSTFGKFGYDQHWLYDPLAMLRVTINGQLYLMMLVEQLTARGFDVISANTDGIITLVPVEKEREYKDLCKLFEEATKFELEFTEYETYARRTVNDYIAITKDGEVKTKGDFNIPDVNNINKDTSMLRRGFDRPIIAIALNEFFKNNTPIKDTILNHKDIYNFCVAKKTDKKFVNELYYLKDNEICVDNLQQSVRYYVSTDGKTLYKRNIKTGKLINYCVGKKVTIFNNYVEHDNYNIDYNYYIQETQKIVDEIIKPQLTLF